MKIKIVEVKYSMKARVKILVNGAAATLLTGAVAAGLIISSTGALQTKNNDVLAARELDETQEEMTREQEPQTEANAELVSAERYQLGMLWEHELTAKKTTEKRNVRDEEHEGKNSNVFRWIVYYDYRNCTVGKIQSRCVAGEFHTIYHDLCMGNRDGKGYDHIPCGTCAYTDPITQEAVQADQSASGGRGNRVRIFYNILQLPGYISAEH